METLPRTTALRKPDFDPLEYIESGFLDTNPKGSLPVQEPPEEQAAIPTIVEYLKKPSTNGAAHTEKPPVEEKSNGKKFRRTLMSAPRPRRSKKKVSSAIDPDLQAVWEALPKNIDFLTSFYDDSVTANYYGGDFKETRKDLIRRLLDPQLSLEEASRLLGVCPATVRRYTNRGWLTHQRTSGGQRRFRLSDVVKFVELHGRFPEE